jgi:hypothetical protein
MSLAWRVAGIIFLYLFLVGCGSNVGEEVAASPVAQIENTVTAPQSATATSEPIIVELPATSTVALADAADGGSVVTEVPSVTPLPENTPAAETTAVLEVTASNISATTVATETDSPTVVPEDTATLVNTATPAPPTNTPTITPTPTPANTATPLPTATPENVAIGNLRDGMTDVTVIGRVVGTDSFARGFKFMISDGTGQIEMVVWDNMYTSVPNVWQLNMGAQVHVRRGEISTFDGQLQLNPVFADRLTIVSPGGPGVAQSGIGALTLGQVGQRVMVVGTVQNDSENSGGVKLTLDDGSGTVSVFMWHNIFNLVPNGATVRTPGTTVRVAGRLSEFQGRLEIIPALPYDIVIQ